MNYGSMDDRAKQLLVSEVCLLPHQLLHDYKTPFFR